MDCFHVNRSNEKVNPRTQQSRGKDELELHWQRSALTLCESVRSASGVLLAASLQVIQAHHTHVLVLSDVTVEVDLRMEQQRTVTSVPQLQQRQADYRLTSPVKSIGICKSAKSVNSCDAVSRHSPMRKYSGSITAPKV